MKQEKEAKNVCNAILGLIHRIVIDNEDRPDEITLVFGDDVLKITANINLEYEIMYESEVVKEIIRILTNDKEK